jgi:hypothetical protein
MHKLDLGDQEAKKVFVTLYLKEPSAYRYYRERLFEQMAKKALE